MSIQTPLPARRNTNRSILFRHMYRNPPMSRPDIVYALRLSMPTVSQIINDLHAMGLILERGVFESTGGRKAKAIALNYAARYAVGLDVTRDHIGIVIIDLSCKVIDFVRFRLPFENDLSYFEEVGRLITQTLSSSKIDRAKVLGVGIGVPAIVSENKRTLSYSPVLGFTHGNLSKFTQYIDFPCVFCNDANAAGFAEIWHRGAASNMVYISLSNSVGGAILIDGAICHGSNQRAGEVGHITIAQDGPVCYCGQRGCLDALCNAKILANSADGRLTTFFQELESEGKHAVLWETYLSNLALAINNLRMTLDSNVVLGGYVGSHMEKHIEALREKVALRNTFEPDASYLDTCAFKFEAIAVGSALHYVDAFIEGL